MKYKIRCYGGKIRDMNRNEKGRCGCDICKKEKPTERFEGYCGGILWVCDKCYSKLIKKKQGGKI